MLTSTVVLGNGSGNGSSYNITNNITSIVNITYNVTNNITFNVTQNVTNNFTSNDGNNYTHSILVSGTSTKTITLGRFGLPNISTTFTDIDTDSDDQTCAEVSGCVVGAITDGNSGWDNSYGFITTDVIVNVASDTLTLKNLNAAGYSDVQIQGNDGVYKGSFGYGNPSAAYFPGQFFIATGGLDIVLAPGLTNRLVVSSGGIWISGLVNSTGNMYAAGSQVCTATNGLCVDTVTNNITQNITYNLTTVNNITYNITNNLTENITYNITQNITNNFTYDATDIIVNVSRLNVSLAELRDRQSADNSTLSGKFTIVWTSISEANTTAKQANTTATAKASPGTCAGKAVQNTTTSGVQCVDFPADSNNYTTSLSLSTVTQFALNATLQRQGMADIIAGANTLNLYLNASKIWVGEVPDARLPLALTRDSEVPSLETDAAAIAYADLLKANITAVNATASAKASPGTCPAGQVVQNTTSSGVQCVPDQTGTSASVSELYFNYADFLRNGSWYTGAHYMGNLANASQAGTWIQAYPVLIGKDFNVTSLGWGQSWSGSNLTGCYVGIYNSSPLGRPTELLLNTSSRIPGYVGSDGTPRHQNTTNTLIPPGLVFFASTCNQTSFRFRMPMNALLPVLGYNDTSGTGSYCTHYHNVSTMNVPLPATFPPQAQLVCGGNLLPTTVFARVIR